MEKLTIKSPEFGKNEMIPSKYTCEGENVNPELKISGVSDNVKSLVLIMDDPDAPAGTWVHWTLWNIEPETAVILEDSVPESAVEGVTSFRKPGYGGPCPPSGTHRYFFKLHALDTALELDEKATAKDIEKAMEGHIVDSSELIGLYKKIK
jgi:Raf kinase inhibitor-like YbhB/YbcL family protein